MKILNRAVASALFCSFLLVGLILPVTFLAARTKSLVVEPDRDQQSGAATPDGAAIYKQKCAVCHDDPQDRVPPLFIIRRRTADDVIQTLTTGVMKKQAEGLSVDEIRAVAIHLTGKQPGTASKAALEANFCETGAGPIKPNSLDWGGWGRDVVNSRYQPMPGLKAEDVPKLKVKWAFGLPGNLTYGQPTAIGDRLFVTSEVGQVFCLNAKTGCTLWRINAETGVRTAINVGSLPSSSPAKFAAYFGDEKSFVHAVDAATGKSLWKTKVEDHPASRVTGAPLLHRNRLYVPVSSYEETAGRDAKYECCKFRGSIVALDAYTGKILWKTYMIAETPAPSKKNSAGTQMYGPAGAAIWATPTLDIKRKVLYTATGNSYTDVETRTTDSVVALDLETGSVKWVNQVTPRDNFLVGCRQPGVGNCPEGAGPDFDFGSSPILQNLAGGKQVVLAGQKSGVMYALDPDDAGKKLWEVKVGNGGALGGIEWGSAADGQNVYAAVADVGGAPDKRRPGLTALRIATGEVIWNVPTPKPVCSWGATRCGAAQSAAITVIPGVVFSGATDGHLRAYSTKDGTVLWDFDTAAKPYETVNGVPAKGGSLDTGGPTVANGIVFVNSGYGRFSGQPGNLLLAFTVDGK